MSILSPAVVASLLAVVVSTLGLIAVQPFLRWRGMVDKPGEGRKHEHATLRGAGIAMVVGLLCAIPIANAIPGYVRPYPPLWLFVGVVLGYGVIGFLDDMTVFDTLLSTKWSAIIRLALQVFFAVVASYCAWRFTYTPLWFALLAVPALIFYVNAVNFMDGVNGITGMHGFVVGGYFAVVAYFVHDRALLVVAIALSLAFVSFLPWNIPRARLFCGDCAAYALGAGIWAMAVWAAASGASHWAVIAPVLIYSCDVLGTIVKRTLRHESLTARHREFIFAQFSDKTSHVTSSVVVTVATIICSLMGLLITLDPHYTVLAVAVMVGTCAAYLLLPMFVRRQERAEN